jgi:hypothetical protein
VNWIRNNPKIAVPGAVVSLGVLAYLAFGVFGIHTKFIDDTVSEDVPVFDAGAASAIPSDVVDQATTDEMNAFMDTDGTPSEVVVDDEMPDMAETTAGAVSDAAPQVMTLIEGRFVDRSHPGSGTAKVITDGSDQRFLRFEDFETDNGPDLFVYLTTADADASAGDFGVAGEFVDLGRLKGNVGAQNYEIPVDVDLAVFDTVVVWCDRFSVAFTAADLA